MRGNYATSMTIEVARGKRCSHNWTPWVRSGVFDPTERRNCKKCKRIQTRQPAKAEAAEGENPKPGELFHSLRMEAKAGVMAYRGPNEFLNKLRSLAYNVEDWVPSQAQAVAALRALAYDAADRPRRKTPRRRNRA